MADNALTTFQPGPGRQDIGPGSTLHERPHPLRWVTGAAVLALLVLLVYAFAQGDISWSVVGKNVFTKSIFKGFLNTILLSVLAMLLGIALGTVFAVMRLSSNPVTSTVAWLYVWLFRGTPVFLQLLIWFNLALIFPHIHIPGIVDAQTIHVITPFTAALLGLGINEGSYLTEVIRGGIISVDQGQSEAAASVGMSNLRMMRYVILPQAMPAIIPPIGNEVIGMLKTSALAAAISYAELLTASQKVYYVNGRVMELLFVAAIWYLAATSVTSVGQYYLERRFGRSAVRRRSLFDQLMRGAVQRSRATTSEASR